MSPSSGLRMLGSLYNRLEEMALVFFVFLLVFLGSLEILFRNLISIGIVWIDPVIRHLVLWVALLGASAATRNNRHIAIDLLSDHIQPAYRSGVQGLVRIFSGMVCLVLVPPAVRFLQSDYESGATLALGIPLWISQAVMPAMMLALAVRFLLQGGHLLISVVRRRNG
jgi:C4-dicarboxylate transporter, DctQ subunit